MKAKPKITATFIITLICAVITLLIAFLPFGETETERAIFFGAYYKAFVIAGEWFRMLTCGFVHVSVLHLLMNMFSLSILGKAMETSLGIRNYLILLLSSIIGGSVFLFCTSGNTVGVGLSGGLYGLLAAYILLVAKAGALKIPQVRNGVLQTVLINLFINFMPGVAWRAHFGGAITGLILIMILKPDPNDKKQRLHASAALVLLMIGAAGFCIRSSTVDSSEIYLLTDLRILKMEDSIGLHEHAGHMASNLDKLYDVTYLEDMLEVKQ